MAMIACKECGTEISSKAETCPKCGIKISNKSIGCGGWILILFLGAVIYSAVSPNRSTNENTNSPQSSVATTTNPAPIPKAPGSQWMYDKRDDSMTNGAMYRAAVLSSNTVNFGFPYAGPQHGTLILRTHPRYGKDVILSIEKGQFLCRSYEDCRVLIRFDDEQAVNFNGAGPSDNSTTTIFIRNYSHFVSKMIKAKIVRISAEVFQNGAPVFEFDVSNFDQNKYIPKT